MVSVDSYIANFIIPGVKGSALLRSRCATTLKNCGYVEILDDGGHGFSVIRAPPGYKVVVHSAHGYPTISDPAEHTRSMIDELYRQSMEIGATPLAFTNVVDARSGESDIAEYVSNALAERANEYGLSILNGELALLDTLECPVSVNGTMISIKREAFPDFTHKGVRYISFDPKGNAVFGNSDGQGTKGEFQARAGRYEEGLMDSAVMKADDSIKYRASPVVFFDLVESNGNVPTDVFDAKASELSRTLKVSYVVVHSNVGNRIKSWADGKPMFNISGSVISVIDEESLRNPLVPSEGDYLIAVRGKPNPRSNGITDKRRFMREMLGEEWHTTPLGKFFLKFLAEPSTMLYPAYRKLVDAGLATGVFQMSGGACDGKLAAPLASHGLYARIRNLYPTDWREEAIRDFSETPMEAAYAKWPMGTQGFVATRLPEETIDVLRRFGLEGKEVSRLEAAGEKSGVELMDVLGSDGKPVYFPGK